MGVSAYARIRQLAALLLFCVLSKSVIASVWIADGATLKRVDHATNQVAVAIPVGSEITALAVDANNDSVWVAAKSLYLNSYAADGRLNATLNLGALAPALGYPRLLAANPHDQSLWVAGGRTLVRIAGNGTKQSTWTSAYDIKSLALDLDESLYVLTTRELVHLNRDGSIAARLDLSSHMSKPKSLALDSLGSLLWVATERKLLQFPIASLGQPPRVLALPVSAGMYTMPEIEALSVHPVFGTLWVASGRQLFLYDREGVLLRTVDLAALGLGETEALAFDPVSLSLWLAGQRVALRLASNGELVARIPLATEGEAIGTPPFLLKPTLALIEPKDGSATNNPMPPIRLDLGAKCNGETCYLADAYIASFNIDANLNGQPIGPSFVLSGTQATYQPGVRLPEGEHTLSASATDLFGHQTESLTSRFTVDTIAPTFLSLTPADGSLFNSPAVTISGSVDEPRSNVILRQNGNYLGMGRANFSFAVTLAPGQNGFALEATDAAGNRRQAALTLLLDATPPVIPNAGLITIGFSIDGFAAITGAAGAVEGGTRVTIRNLRTGETVTVTANADGSFSTRIAARPGDEFSITTKDAAGNESDAVRKSVPFQGVGVGNVIGTVLDAASGQPLAGVRVFVQELGASVVTDGTGRFALPVAGRYTWSVFLERSGFITTRRDAYVGPGGTLTLGEIKLRAWDSRVVRISALSGGTFRDSTGNVEVNFPPGALPRDTDILGTFLPDRASFPAELPENLAYAGGVQMGPEHIAFNSPVTVRVRNVLGLPPGTSVPFFFASHDPEDTNPGFYDPGTGTVTTDGAFVEYQVSHFSCMALGPPAPGAGGPGTGNGNDDCGSCCGGGAGASGSSEIQHCTGNLKLRHELPPVYAFGRDDAPALVYDGSTADPRPYLSTNLDMAGYYSRNPNRPIRATRLRWRIADTETVAYVSPSETAQAVHFKWPGTNGAGQRLPSGSYAYELVASDIATIIPTPGGAGGGGGGGGTGTMVLPEPIAFSVNIPGRAILHDRTGSTFGAGWELAELERIHRSPDDTLLLTRGNGIATVYHPAATAPGSSIATLASGLSNPISIARGPDGSAYVSTSGGSIHRIAPGGATTQVASGIGYGKGLAVAGDGTIYVVNTGGTVYRLLPGGTPQPFAQLSGIDHMDDVAIGPDGHIYVLDGGFGTIHKVSPTGQASIFYSPAQGGQYINNGMSMTFDRLGNLYVTSNYNGFGQVRCGYSYISKFDRLGNHSYHYVGLDVPRGLVADDSGNLFVADYDCTDLTYRIKMITPRGEVFTVAAGLAGDANAFGLAYDLTLSGGRVLLVRPQGDVLALTPVIPGDSVERSFRARPDDFTEIYRDAAGNYTRTERGGVVRRYNAQGLLVETRVPQGLTWQYAYDSGGRLMARTNAAGQRWEFRYSGSRVSQIVDPAGRMVQLTIDGANNLVRVDEPEAASMSYVYGANHQVLAKTDSRGNTARYTYGPAGNVTEARQVNGEVRRFDSGRARAAITPDQAAASSLYATFGLPSPASLEDRFINGRGNTVRFMTDRNGQITRQVDALGNETRIERNRLNQETRRILPNGATVTSTYGSAGRLTRREATADGLGRPGLIDEFQYDTRDRVVAVNSNYMPSRQMVYDDRDNLVRLVTGDSSSNITVNFTYDSLGQPLTREVAGRVTRYEHDTAGRLIRLTDPMNQATEFTYDIAGNIAVVRDPMGRTTRHEYDLLGRRTRTVDPLGGETRYTYLNGCATCGTARYMLAGLTDQMGRVTRFEYNEFGQLIRETNPAGQVTSYTYDGSRNLATRTDPNGITVTYEYDANDRPVRKTMPSETVDYAYDTVGNLTSVRDADSALSFAYDLARRPTRIEAGGSAQAAVVQDQYFSGYDRYLLNTTAGAIIRGRNTYFDTLHRITGVAGQGAMTFGYDALGRRTSQTEGFNIGARLNYEYDDASRLLAFTGNYTPGQIAYQYDATGNRTSALVHLAADAPLARASLDRTEVSADTLTVTGRLTAGYTVSVNNVAMTVAADGTVQGQVPLAMGYNALGVDVRDDTATPYYSTILGITRSNIATQVQIQRLLAAAPNGDLYLLDQNNQPYRLRAGSGALDQPAWLTGASDVAVSSAGRLYLLKGTQLSRVDGTVETPLTDLGSLTPYDMDVGPDDQVYLATDAAIYRLSAQGTPVLHTTLPASVSGSPILLDASSFGLVAAARAGGSFFRILPDGSYTTLFQDYVSRDFAVAPDGTVCYIGEGFGCRAADGSLIDPSFSTTQSIEFGTDGAAYTTDTANVYRWEAGTAITLLNQNTLPGTLSIEARSPIVRYAYNARDELTGVSGGRSESYAYDPAGNRTQDHRAGDYVYNNLNQLISGNGNTYSYDANGNRVTKTNSAGTTRYQYDAENRLTRIDLPDGTQAHYAYDPFGRRIQKRIVDSQGQETLRRYVYDREDILFELDQNNQLVSEFLHGPGIDEPLLLARNNQIYTYHRDALGSIIAITDQSNTIVQRYTYDAYGNLTASNPDFRQPYAYTGREYDEESGLYYYRARYYDSEVGRFITRDPIGLRGGHNLYAYVRNNPMRFADPSGLSTIEYNSTSGSLYVFDSQGFPTGGSPYSASNNAASNSAGSWPSGTHPYSYYVPHVGDGPNDTFGSNGNFVFNVPNRTGMGVHSGMRDSCDLAGRCGYEYATEGCIRTTDEATEEIKRLHEGGDPLKEIRVTP